MASSTAAKVHDPLYNFETHFPERLSRLHLHHDFNSSGSFRKKTRAQRSGARYKTQPVTFDEIQEVDEEPAATEEKPCDKLKGQFQAFSRSMDGLVPRVSPDSHHVSHSRSGSRKFQRHPQCILEKEGEPELTPKAPEDRLREQAEAVAAALASAHEREAAASQAADGGAAAAQGQTTLSTEDGGVARQIPSPNIAPRRQKITAKAKKRQKASETDSAA